MSEIDLETLRAAERSAVNAAIFQMDRAEQLEAAMRGVVGAANDALARAEKAERERDEAQRESMANDSAGRTAVAGAMAAIERAERLAAALRKISATAAEASDLQNAHTSSTTATFAAGLRCGLNEAAAFARAALAAEREGDAA